MDAGGTDANQFAAALTSARHGDRGALDLLIPEVYDELRRIAQAAMNRENVGHTLQATAVANEAYLRLVGQREADFESRAHFFALAATLIRRILVDHARARVSQKRGGAAQRLTLSGIDVAGEAESVDMLAIEEALDKLQQLDEGLSRLVELRFFAGMSVDEAAAVLGISPRKAAKDWSFTRAWLAQQLRG